MAAADITGPPTVTELERLSQSYTARSVREHDLALALRHQDLPQAADNNSARARVHKRTADILTAYARELEARAAQAPADLMAAE
nr:hypothetical protein NG677_04390 [Methylobacterium sp. OTU13CASTA1]